MDDATSLEEHPVAHRYRSSRFGMQFRWRSVDAFLTSPRVQDGVHAVPLPGVADTVYEFYVRIEYGAPLLAHFHGAATRREDDVPLIAGLPISAGLSATLVIPSDPILSLAPDVRIGWHVGPNGTDVHAIAVQVLQHVAAVASASRIIAWGGSGGGYAAIRVARDIPGAIAFVWNPQTSIDAYSAPAVRAFRTVGGHQKTVFAKRSETDLSAPGAWARFRGTVLCFQEESDWHVAAHLMPMLRAAGSAVDQESLSQHVTTRINPSLAVAVSHWGDGHAPLPRPIIAQVLGHLCAAAEHNDEPDLEAIRRRLLAARVLRSPIAPLDHSPLEEHASTGPQDLARDLSRALVSLLDLRDEGSDDFEAASRTLESMLHAAERLPGGVESLSDERARIAGMTLFYLAHLLAPALDSSRLRVIARALFSSSSVRTVS